MVGGPGQVGLGRLELGGGRLELGLEGPLAAAGVLQRGRLDGGDPAVQQQGKHGKAEEDSGASAATSFRWGERMAVCDDIGGSDSLSPSCGLDQIGEPSAVEGGQAFGLVLQPASGRRAQRLERLQQHPALLVAPGPGDRPVDQEGRVRVGGP